MRAIGAIGATLCDPACQRWRMPALGKPRNATRNAGGAEAVSADAADAEDADAAIFQTATPACSDTSSVRNVQPPGFSQTTSGTGSFAAETVPAAIAERIPHLVLIFIFSVPFVSRGVRR